MGSLLGAQPSLCLGRGGRMDLITADRHGIEQPFLWSRKPARVYPANKVAGECYYKPMVDYIDWKELDWEGMELSEAVLRDITARPRVHLPLCGEMRLDDIEEDWIAPEKPNLARFLTEYGARQAKHQQGQTVHCKHQFFRSNMATRGILPSSETIGWPSDAAKIRYPYISKLSTQNRMDRRLPYCFEIPVFQPSAKTLLHAYKHYNEFTK